MPLFEYRCEDCGAVTEFLEKAGAKAVHACGKCGSRKTEKMFSSFAAQVAADSSPAPACGRSCASGSCPYAQG